MAAVKLFAYQKRGITAIRKLWMKRVRSVLAVAPVGAGKMTMQAAMVRTDARRGERVLCIVHLRDIAEDLWARLNALGVRSGMFLPGHEPDSSAKVQIASTQTMLRSKRIMPFDKLYVDEAHHYAADEWKRVIKRTRAKHVCGFTATPQRADGKSMGDVFDELVDVVSYGELLAQKRIVPCRLLVPPHRLDGDIAMEPAAAYLKYAKGESAFVFVRSLSTAEDVRSTLVKAGVATAIITDKTPHADRSAFLRGLRKGSLKVIVNYATMTEGIDTPIVSTVVLEQSCHTLGAYVQRVGRAMRAYRGKKSATVIDLRGAAYEHQRFWEIELNYDDWRGAEPVRLPPGFERIRGRSDIQTPDVLRVDLVEADAAWISTHGGARIVRWDQVDWTRSNQRIGRDLGVSAGCVRNKRIALGEHATDTRDFGKVDWSMPVAHIARLMQCGRRRVLVERKSRGIPSASKRGLIKEFEWSGVNWSKTNHLLSSELGFSVDVVKRHRRQYDRDYKPPPAFSPGARQSLIGSMRDSDVAAAFGTTKAVIKRWRKKHGIPAFAPRQAPRQLLRPSEWAASVGISRTKAYRAIKKGLPVVLLGASARIDPIEAMEWLKKGG